MPEEIKQTLGGQVALQLLVKVAPQTRVAPAMNTVTLRLREEEDKEHKVKHAEAQDHAEFEFDLNDPQWDVWSAKYERSGPASTPQLIVRADERAARVKEENVSLDTDILYIRTVPWNTTAKLPTDLDGAGPRPASVLLGHNGEHQVALHEVNGEQTSRFLFDKLMQQGRWESLPYSAAPTKHQVGNLVITQATTNQEKAGEIADYFKFDPHSEDDSFVHPTVSFKFTGFDQTASSDRYNWWLYVRATTVDGYSNFLTYEGKVDKPGEVTVAINKEAASYQKTAGNDLNDWGTYAFDVTIQDTKTGDGIRLRTSPEELKVAQQLVDLNGQPFKNADGENIVGEDDKLLPGHELVIEEDERDVEVPLRFFYSYTLRGKKDASRVKIDLLGPDLSLAATKDGGTTIGEYNYLHLFDATDDVQGSDGSGWKGVMIATDAFKESYRDHKNRSALAVNETKFQLPLLVFSVFSSSADGTSSRKSPGKIVNGGNPKDGGYLPEVGKYAGKGVIPVFAGDPLKFATQFRSNSNYGRTSWSWLVTQGTGRKGGEFGSNRNFYPTTFAGAPDTPQGIAPTVGFAKMTSPEGERNAVVVIERKILPPRDDDAWGLAVNLSPPGFGYAFAQIPGKMSELLKSKTHIDLQVPSFSSQIQSLIDSRRLEIPEPNSGGRPANADAMHHSILGSWLLRGIMGQGADFQGAQQDALVLTDAHEYSGYDGKFGKYQSRPDQVMDLLNNRIMRRGRQFYNTVNTNPKQPTAYDDDELFDLSLNMLQSHQLVTIDEAAKPKGGPLDDAGLLVPTPLKQLPPKRTKR